MALRNCQKNNVSNLKTSISDEIYHKMFTFFSSKLNSNAFPSNSHGGKPKKRLDFSLQEQLFSNVYSLILENTQYVLSSSVCT